MKIASLLDIAVRKTYRMPVKVTVAGEMGHIKLTASTSISAAAQRIIEDFVKSRFEPPV